MKRLAYLLIAFLVFSCSTPQKAVQELRSTSKAYTNSQEDVEEVLRQIDSTILEYKRVAQGYKNGVLQEVNYNHLDFIKLWDQRIPDQIRSVKAPRTIIKELRGIPNVKPPEIPVTQLCDSIFRAFPTALGAGAFARADVNYTLYEVTNLNATGEGSLWNALGDNRIVVFRVSGIIDLPIIQTKSFKNCIVLGQTAPKGGITVVNYGWKWNGVENIVFRYVKFRVWQGRKNTENQYDTTVPNGVDAIDVFGLNGNVNSNIIFDHCSFAFGGDEALSFRGDTHTVTVQNTLFSYGKTGMLAGDSDDTSRGYNISILNNFWTTFGKRTPNPNSNGRIDIIGNVTYKMLNQLNRTGGSLKLNDVGNYHHSNTLQHPVNFSNGWTPKIYTDDVERFGSWYGGREPINTPDSPQNSDFVYTPYPYMNYFEKIPTKQESYERVLRREDGANGYLDNTGKFVFDLDWLDQEAYREHETNTGFDWTDQLGGTNRTQGNWKFIPQRQWLLDNMSNFGVIVNKHNQSTHTGVVPNVWITAQGLNPETFNPLGKDLCDNYTNIEVYSFEVDRKN